MEPSTRRRPIWQPSLLARMGADFKETLRGITFGRVALAILVLPLMFYVIRELTSDILIIDPFIVPKHFEEAGLTSDAMANRLGNTIHQIEVGTRTRIKKDSLISLHDQGSIPDVEIPGTKLGLKTVVDILRDVFGIYPKHIGGDIVVSTNVLKNGESQLRKRQAAVTIYLTQGQSRIAAATTVVPDDDFDTLVQRAAETALGEVNAYVLAVYREEHRRYDEAIEIIERINKNPLEDRAHKKASLILWGVVLSKQQKYDEAITKYQKGH
jgi:tetratricopeptide (TPR) repeat protein